MQLDNRGSAILAAVVVLAALTVLAMTLINMGDYYSGRNIKCESIARMRAMSCVELFKQAVSESKLPSFKLNNLDDAGDSKSIECLIPSMTIKGGATAEGEGGVTLGLVYADNFSTDFQFRLITAKAVGFAGKECGENVFSADNDLFGALTGEETAAGLYIIVEFGISYGPCKRNSPC